VSLRRRSWLGRLRPRLTVTLALAAAVTAVAVAVASYVVVRDVRLRRETDSAVRQSRFNLEFAAETLPTGATEAELRALVTALERRGGFDVLTLSGDRTFQSSVSLSRDSIPADLRAAVGDGRIVVARRSVSGHPEVIVGAALPPGEEELWFFFPLDDLYHDLDTLAVVLATSALVMVALSAGVGAVAARGMLRPIGRARDAAHRLEAGALETRLPSDGSDEFAELSRSFNQMATALERTVGELRDAEAGHRRFVADVSHELRTPVTALSTAAELLEPQLDQLAEPDRRAAQVLVSEARRLRQLVEDLMEVSRLDAGVAAMDWDLIDVRRLLVGAMADRGWTDRVRIDGTGPVLVRGDRRRLDRVFTNLVDNSLHHGRPPVNVRITRSADEVAIEVRDHGPGILPEEIPRVFERFFKADPARPRSAGSGLGLAIAAENVALHGGRIEVDNHPEGGARFVVTLPAASVAELLPPCETPVTDHEEGEAPEQPKRKSP
jgi:two-component system, OmpR family, sensor histidine kinase MtrB